MNPTLTSLIRLQELTRHYEAAGHPAGEHKRIARLRAGLPANLLRRFDHLAEHGRGPVAPVSESGACGSCHLKLAPGDLLRCRHAQETDAADLPLCPFCGCFLYAPEAVADPKEAAPAVP